MFPLALHLVDLQWKRNEAKDEDQQGKGGDHFAFCVERRWVERFGMLDTHHYTEKDCDKKTAWAAE